MVKPEKFGHLTFKRQPHKMEEGAQACQSENFFFENQEICFTNTISFFKPQLYTKNTVYL